MVEMKNILLISNGHGEDLIGARLLKELVTKVQTGIKNSIKVLPVVGKGNAYQGLPVDLVGPRRVLPSGGFSRNGIKNLIADLKGGLLQLTFDQIKLLKRLKGDIDLVIVVGDIFILLLASLFIGKKIIFLPTAKSDYIGEHYWIEKYLMKRKTELVFPRDKKTARSLRDYGINTKFVGNIMMDSFEIKGVDFQLLPGSRIVGILPGSREEAYDNMGRILKIIEKIEAIKKERLEYLTALAGSLSLDKMILVAEELGWKPLNPSENKISSGIGSILLSPAGKSRVCLIYHHFGDVLDQAEMFIGLAGTANEQAAGMGKPVITFPGGGSQFTLKFARAQKRLLGDSVSLIEDGDPGRVAREVVKVLEDESLYTWMGEAGRKRMGPPGGTRKMVDIIYNNYIGS